MKKLVLTVSALALIGLNSQALANHSLSSNEPAQTVVKPQFIADDASDNAATEDEATTNSTDEQNSDANQENDDNSMDQDDNNDDNEEMTDDSDDNQSDDSDNEE